ncbi:Uncharacterized protein PECH_004721 [Penicillium ucsense]|uniref:Uncharacterized protein n=1 Tax=Penicillium ucsense TaxID=2839758 RepID=A0A8J8WIJ4_9EURO|nr:Uncharacterized protein PECM_004134 [Penicillium ucsense]KAF7726232.1 Uncharacterized protein PECH_004721 [Penicillium ucsense]
MHFTQTILSAAMLILPAYAGFPVVNLEFQSYESCPVGYPGQPATGVPKSVVSMTSTPLSCDKTTVNRDWDVNNYAFKATMDTKDAYKCAGVSIWNNDDCTGEPVFFLPFDGQTEVQGQCLPDMLELGFISFQTECYTDAV